MYPETEEELQARLNEFFPGAQIGLPPFRDQVQQVLTRKFVQWIEESQQSDIPTDTFVETFATCWYGQLLWLGETRQDEILQAAMRETGVDLSHWLTKEEE